MKNGGERHRQTERESTSVVEDRGCGGWGESEQREAAVGETDTREEKVRGEELE